MVDLQMLTCTHCVYATPFTCRVRHADKAALRRLCNRRNPLPVQQAVSFASAGSESDEHNPNLDEAHKEDYITTPLPEVPASIREHLEEEKWPHASDEERRSDMKRAQDAEMPTEFSPTPNPKSNETPERKPTGA